MPRFQEPHFAANRGLLPDLRALAQQAGRTPAQLALAWLLRRAAHILPIPGTTSVSHLEENLGTADGAQPDGALLERLDSLINTSTVAGPRYPNDVLAEIDTEEPPGAGRA